MIIFTDENIPPYLAPGFQLIQGPESLKTGIPVELKHIPQVFGRGCLGEDWILGKFFNMVNGYVQNRQQPRFEVLFEIARILEVEPKDLLKNKK